MQHEIPHFFLLVEQSKALKTFFSAFTLPRVRKIFISIFCGSSPPIYCCALEIEMDVIQNFLLISIPLRLFFRIQISSVFVTFTNVYAIFHVPREYFHDFDCKYANLMK